MLGFILSKMQMLLFATGVLIVALMFYQFVSGVELTTASSSVISSGANMVREQLSSDSLCSFKMDSIPERIMYGVGMNQFFYDLTLSKETIGDTNVLIFAISEHKKTNIIASRSVSINGSIVLISSEFIPEDEPMNEQYYDVSETVLYPRSALKAGQSSSINSFVALKEVLGGHTTIYIIPCSVSGNQGAQDNCIVNIAKIGCYRLSKMNPQPNDTLPQCFDVSADITKEGETIKQSLTFATCKEYGYI